MLDDTGGKPEKDEKRAPKTKTPPDAQPDTVRKPRRKQKKAKRTTRGSRKPEKVAAASQPKTEERQPELLSEPKKQVKKTAEQKKIVLFRLSNEFYGIDVSNIDEIIDARINEKISGMPDFVAGVISLRGESIPVLSLHHRFHLAESTREEIHTVLITSKNGEVYGICIDELQGVIDIKTTSILSVPSIFPEDEMVYLKGIIQYGKEIAALIDIEQVLYNYRSG